MEIILDTSNLKDIRKWSGLLNVNHITTNPHLLKEAGIISMEKFKEFVTEIEEFIPNPVIFFQCISEEDVLDLKELAMECTNTTFVAKVTMLPEFYPVMKTARETDLAVAATTCYDLVQINQAGEWDMEFSMVYFAKNENETLLADAVKMKNDYDYITNMVAASFRTKKDFVTAIKSGIEYATVPPCVLEEAYSNLSAEKDVKKIRGEE
jgi:transaldolase